MRPMVALVAVLRIVEVTEVFRAPGSEPLASLAAYYRPEYRLSQHHFTGGGTGMRMPVKSERDAFRIAYGSALLIVAAVLVGALVHPALGVAVVVVGVGVVLLWDLRTQDPDRRQPLREAAGSVRRSSDGRRRILVVANETLCGDELRDELAGRGPRIRWCAWWRRCCRRDRTMWRRTSTASWARRETAWMTRSRGRGARAAATGRVSDVTPLSAIEDELRSFPADELLISTHPPQRSRWLESGLVERARAELDIPVTHVVVDLARRSAVVES